MLQGQSVAQAKMRLSVISGHHRSLSTRVQDVLLLEALGFEPREIAAMLGTSEHTVRHQASKARAEVVPARLSATRANASVWVACHQTCCMASAIAALHTLKAVGG